MVAAATSLGIYCGINDLSRMRAVTVIFLAGIACWLNMAMAQVTIILRPDPVKGKDASLYNCVPCGWLNTNFGTHKSFPAIAWTNGGAISYVRALVEFDLDGLPDPATFLEGRLSLFHDPVSNEGQHSSLSGPNTCLIQRVIEPWEENVVTWQTQPATTTLNQVVLPPATSPTQDCLDIDVTALVADMLADPSQSHGFMLRVETEQHYRRMIFASSDHPDKELHPMLVLTYGWTVGVDGQGDRPGLWVYPNPTEGPFFIGVGGTSPVSFDVLDLNGRAVTATQSMMPGVHTIDLSGLSKGVYIARMHDRDRFHIERIVLH